MEIPTILWSISLVVIARTIIYQFSKRPSMIIKKCDQTREQLIDVISISKTIGFGNGTTYEELWIWVTKKGWFNI
jgi:hypothetical protein